MIPAPIQHQAVVGGALDSMSFEISSEDTAHIMSMLRDQMYSDKILAVLREYAANAWDAHRQSGQPNLPIYVRLPTQVDPRLVIRDYGRGMSPEEIHGVFTRYGASGKRNDNLAVGCLGIGSKSGFAYRDSFTVTSHHGGWCRVYVAAMDASNKGTFSLLHQEPSSETGMEIEIEVRPGDIPEFHERAAALFGYFQPPPQINLPIEDRRRPGPGQPSTSVGYLTDGGQWTAVMGCIPYRLNIAQIPAVSLPGSTGGVLFFDIGEVDIAASREELKYSDRTKAAIAAKIDALVTELGAQALALVNDKSMEDWQRRWKLAGTIALCPVLARLPGLTVLSSMVSVDSAPFDFHRLDTLRGRLVTHRRRHHITVSPTTVFILAPSLSSYRLELRRKDDILVIPQEDAAKEHPEEALRAWMQTKGLVGAPVTTVAERRGPRAPRVSRPRVPRRRTTAVRLVGAYQDKSLSAQWTPEDPPTTGEFILVAVARHRSTDLTSHASLNTVADEFKVRVPPIYGVSLGDLQKVRDQYPQAMTYDAFRRRLLDQVMATDVGRELAVGHASTGFNPEPQLIKGLPDDHAFRRLYEAQRRPYHVRRALGTLASAGYAHTGYFAAQEEIVKVLQRYPLLTHIDHLNTKTVLDYIALCELKMRIDALPVTC